MSASRIRAAALATARQRRPRRPQPWALDSASSPVTAAAAAAAAATTTTTTTTTAALSLHSTSTSTAPVTAATAQPQPTNANPLPMANTVDVVTPAPLGRNTQGLAFFSSTPRSAWPHSSSPRTDSQPWVSDDEFQLRVGRAIDLLRATMPDFLRTGLSDYDSVQSSGEGAPGRNRTGLHLPKFHLAGLLQGGGGNATHANQHHHNASIQSDSHFVPVYHPSIKFCVKAMGSSASPSSSPDSDPDSTPGISFRGRILYHGSAHVLRHALAALFYDARVALESVQLVRGPSDCSGSSADSTSSQTGPQPSKPATNMPFGPTSGFGDASRNLSLLLRLRFDGSLRVTGAQHTYHLLFRYDFDPSTGQIGRHTVERIEPALGRKLWAGLSTAFLRLAGLEPAPSGQPQPATAARSYLSSAVSRGREVKDRGRGVDAGRDVERGARDVDEVPSSSNNAQRGAGAFLSPQPAMSPLPPRRRMPMVGGRPLLRGQHRELCTSAVRREAKYAEDEEARKALSAAAQAKEGQSAASAPSHDDKPSSSISLETSREERDLELDEEAYKAAILKARLSLTFTCTVTDCGHRSTHEFSRHSYERGIVIVQCPGCKNQHLIADHLSWFTETADEPRTIEQIVAANGGTVRRGVAYSNEETKGGQERGTGETVEIVAEGGQGAKK